jgi:diacylglycerol kinase (ATP)
MIYVIINAVVILVKKYIIICKKGYNEKKTNEFISYIQYIMRNYGYCANVLISNYQGNNIEYARKYSHYTDMIISVGGDGTFHEVVKGILSGGNINTLLLHIPFGTANDMGVSFKYNNNLESYIKESLYNNPIDYDIFRLNDEIFTYVAAGGYLTNVAHTPSFMSKKILRKGAYLCSIANEVLKKPAIHNISFTVDEKSYEGEYIAMILSNSYTIGSFNIYDDISLNDGICELMMIRNDKKDNIIFDGLKVLSRKMYLTDISCVESYRGRDFTFYLKEPFIKPFDVDGEKSNVYGCNNLKVDLYKKIKVLVPNSRQK